MKKRILAMVTAAICGLALLTSCGQKAVEDTQNPMLDQTMTAGGQGNTDLSGDGDIENDDNTAEDVVIRIGAMSGPTAMGMVKLMANNEEGACANTYEFAELSTDPAAFVAPIAKGELDMAAVPANLAANLYQKTEGKVCVVAVNTLGVLYVVERGESVASIADLSGKKVYATGQGAVPEYTIRHLLKANDMDPDTDLSIQWCADTTEALSYVSSDENAIAILPQPFATAACAQVEGLRVALDLNEAWDALGENSQITTGVIVVRKQFLEEHKGQVEAFLKEYEASVAYTNENPSEAAALVEKYGIVAKAAIAEKAIPKCHIVFLSGDDMKDSLSGFLEVLYTENPESVGGAVPGEDFYYKAE